MSTQSNLSYIQSLMELATPESTLEVGLALGASCVTFAAKHRDLQHRLTHSHPNHIAIDPFQTSVWDDAGKLKVAEASLDQFVEVIETPSCIALPNLLSEGQRFGIIYIDGSHLFEDVFVDAYFCAAFLRTTDIFCLTIAPTNMSKRFCPSSTHRSPDYAANRSMPVCGKKSAASWAGAS